MSSTTNFNKQAGKSQKNINESASNCIKPIPTGQQTPEHIKRFRKSAKIEPGKVILHYGIANDPRPINVQHGLKTYDSNHVDQIFQDANAKGINSLVNQIKESKYASRKNEPLGRPIERNYNYPAECSRENFSYGVSTEQNEVSGKEVIFPPDRQIKETDEDRQRYIKTHQLYDPGEQKKRNYQWPEQINNNHRFGKAEKVVYNQASEILKPDDTSNRFPQTVLVAKNLEDYRNFKDEPLGKCKNLGQTNVQAREDQVFGFKNTKHQLEWSTGQCLRGQATIKESLADDNLGRATKFGYRNQTKEGDETRVFGVPTIRNDIKKPDQKSVADPNNYGDEPVGVQLLFPDKYSTMGLTQEDFTQLRSKQDIKDIFKSIGISYISGKFETVYKRAQEIQQSYKDVSCQAFLQAVQELHDYE